MMEMYFKSLNIVATREEPVTKTKRITVVARLPSSANKIDFTIRILEGGMASKSVKKWPSPMIHQ